MRTQDEIAERLDETLKLPLNFEPDVLLPFLDYERAKPYLKPEATEERWNKCRLRTDEDALNEAKAYMVVGWDKAINHRGISANRTVQKMCCWMWLVGNDELMAVCNDDSKFAQYGAPVLAAICGKLGWPIPNDDGLKNMIAGRPCHDECQ